MELRKAVDRVFSAWWEAMGKKAQLKLLSTLLCGKCKTSPFDEVAGKMEVELLKVLNRFGFHRACRPEDRSTPVKVRLLQSLAAALGDADHEYLEELITLGVPLGVNGEIPRIPAVYEEKVKWVLPEGDLERWEEEQLRDNYQSATEHLSAVADQIQEDVETGRVLKMSLEEARARFGKDLKVASLGAVPKDAEWSKLRVVHDATHGVEVNHRIKLVNQMRFPLFDDLEATLLDFLAHGHRQKLVMGFDYKAAHRLIPVREQDWGLQSFRLDDSDTVYVNTCGTFGVGSAAFWWGRLAGTLQRVIWELIPFSECIYMLLYADDGLILAAGENYQPNLLKVLALIDTLGAPLSWAKCRGGLRMEWLGYFLDIEAGVVGVSGSKTRWLEEWVTGVLKDMLVTGREFKSALGRMGFLAGPVKQARPFLALAYSWAAKISAGTASSIPLSVALTLKFFLEAVKMQPVRAPQGIPRVGGEIFRVDAKADQTTVSIGGWESWDGTPPGQARWFSICLGRHNAPWIFSKGEPFKVIASLELLAVTVAVMIFSKGARWKECAGRMVLPAYTDSLVNSYVLDKYMSTSFPLSVVLMELAVQLQDLQVDLDLQWVPRDQNSLADSLTNLDFESFDKDLRMDLELKDLEFKILPALMALASEIDEEIIQKKTSKEVARKTPVERKMRLTQPW